MYSKIRSQHLPPAGNTVLIATPLITLVVILGLSFSGLFFEGLLLIISGFLVLSVAIWASHSAWRISVLLILVGTFQEVLALYLAILPHIMTGLLLGMFVLLYGRTERTKLVVKTPIFRLLLLVIVMIALSTLASFDKEATTELTLNIIQKLFLITSVLTFVSAISSESELKGLMEVFTLCFMIYAAISAAEFYLGILLLPFARMGEVALPTNWTNVDINRLDGYQFRGYLRSMGENRFALWAAFVSLMSLSIASDQKFTRYRRLIYLGIAMLSILIILATGSRSGILSLIAGYMVWHSATIGFASSVRWASVGLLAIALYNIVIPDQFTEFLLFRLGSDLQEGSLRYLTWSVSWDLFLQNPLFGAGVGGFREYFEKLGLMASLPWAGDPHNSFLGLLAEHGVVVATPYFLALALVWYRIAQWGHRNGYSTSIYVFVAILTATITSMIFNSYSFEWILWLVFSVGIVAELDLYPKPRLSSPNNWLEA